MISTNKSFDGGTNLIAKFRRFLEISTYFIGNKLFTNTFPKENAIMKDVEVRYKNSRV